MYNASLPKAYITWPFPQVHMSPPYPQQHTSPHLTSPLLSSSCSSVFCEHRHSQALCHADALLLRNASHYNTTSHDMASTAFMPLCCFLLRQRGALADKQIDTLTQRDTHSHKHSCTPHKCTEKHIHKHSHTHTHTHLIGFIQVFSHILHIHMINPWFNERWKAIYMTELIVDKNGESPYSKYWL